MPGQKEEQQSGLWDLEVDDAELLEACETLNDDNNKAIVKKMNDAREVRREKVAALEDRIRDTVGSDAFDANGARVRVGDFVLNVGNRAGGGFEVEKWEKVGVLSMKGAIYS